MKKHTHPNLVWPKVEYIFKNVLHYWVNYSFNVNNETSDPMQKLYKVQQKVMHELIKLIHWMQCKSLWIKVPAKCIKCKSCHHWNKPYWKHRFSGKSLNAQSHSRNEPFNLSFHSFNRSQRALFHCMAWHGMVQYGSFLGVFHWVQ